MNRELVKYIKSQIKEGYTKDNIRAFLTQKGWKEKDINKAFSHLKPHYIRNTLLLMLILIVILCGGLFYYVFSPISVNKPILEKPLIIDAQEKINSSHVEYLFNEIGFFNLHNKPLSSDKPQIEVLVGEKYYAVSVENNRVNAVEGRISNPDLRVKMAREDLVLILQSDNLQEIIAGLAKSNKIQVEPVADMETLALKGYKSLLDYMVKKN
jgi:hypothetical protein